MATAGAAIAAWWAAEGAATVVTAICVMAANMILDSILAEGAPEIDPNAFKQEGSRGHLVNTRDTQQPLSRIYGDPRVGINQVYLGTSGADNKYIHIIGTVGEGEVNGVAQVDSIDQVFLDDEIYTEFGSLVHYEFFTGTSTQNVCATLNTAIPAWTDPLRNTAYLYMRIEYDSDVFQSLPNITLKVEGLKVFDPRDDTTAYSNNAALAARDLILASSLRGGMQIASGRLDTDSWKDAANYCDAKGWTIGMPVNKPQAVIDNLSAVLSCYRGAVIYSDNLFKGRYKDLNYESAVMDIDEDDVIEVGESSLRVLQPSVFDTPNAVRIKFLNKELKYQVDDYVKSDSTAIAADGDYREKELELLGINTLENAQKMANYFLERFRVNKTAPFTARDRCMSLEPMDLIQLTHSFPGWTDKLLRVTNAQFVEGLVQLDTIEEESDFYDDTYNLDSHDWHDTTLPRPSASPYSVINVSHVEEVYYYRNRSFTRWKVDFDKPAVADYPWWDYAEIWIKVGVAGSWKFMTKATTDYMLDPVEEGETHYCKMRSVSIHGVKEDFDSAQTVSKAIVGRTDVPTDMSAITAVASGDKVSVYGDELADPDIAGYELRFGTAWVGGVFVAFNETPNFRLAGVRPATFTFWCKGKDNAGRYAANPVSTSVIVFYPANYSDKNTWSWDFNEIGTHDNTEYWVPSVSDDNLIGYWPLDETSGTNAPDESGNSNDGTLVNMEDADWVDGKVGKCLSFDGTNEYVLTDPIVFSGNMTISGWVKPDTFDTGYESSFGCFQYHGGSSGTGWSVTPIATAIRLCVGRTGVNYITHNFSCTIPTTSFSHVVITYDSGSFKAYLNGEQVGSGWGQSAVYNGAGDKVHIGRWAWDYNGCYYKGKIDEVRIYDKALSAAEIKTLYENPSNEYLGITDVLKCSHTGGVLVGTWTSPEYDLGSEKTVRVWGDFRTSFVSSAVSWEGIFPGATLWSAKTDADTKWYDLTAPDVAAILSAKIKWGTATGVYPYETDFFEILSPEFTARYLQVEIKIIDPQADANLFLRELNLKAAYWS